MIHRIINSKKTPPASPPTLNLHRPKSKRSYQDFSTNTLVQFLPSSIRVKREDSSPAIEVANKSEKAPADILRHGFTKLSVSSEIIPLSIEPTVTSLFSPKPFQGKTTVEKMNLFEESLQFVCSSESVKSFNFSQSIQTIFSFVPEETLDHYLKQLQEFKKERVLAILSSPQSLQILFQDGVSLDELNKMDDCQFQFLLKYPEGLEVALLTWCIPFSFFFKIDGWRIQELLCTPNDFTDLMHTFVFLEIPYQHLYDLDISHLSSILSNPTRLENLCQKGLFNPGDLNSLTSDQLSSFLAYADSVEMVMSDWKISFGQLAKMTGGQLDAIFDHYGALQDFLSKDEERFSYLNEMSPARIHSFLAFPGGIDVLVENCSIPLTEFKNIEESLLYFLLSKHNELRYAIEQCKIPYHRLMNNNELWVRVFLEHIEKFEKAWKNKLLTLNQLEQMDDKQLFSIVHYYSGFDLAVKNGIPVSFLKEKESSWLDVLFKNPEGLKRAFETKILIEELFEKNPEELSSFLESFLEPDLVLNICGHSLAKLSLEKIHNHIE